MVTGDCHDQHGLKNRCVAGAIKNFTSQLLHYQEGSSDRKCQLNVPENCKSWIGTWQFRKQRKFSSFEISTAKGNLKNEFFPQNVNEDNKWCFDLFYAKNLKFFFSGLLWQIIWLKHCCSYHTSWEISIRCSIVISMQEIPSHFLENFCTYQFSCLTRTHFCLAL